jgi:diguanylate cyclase (GGDEF)-like protein/PAS domain S-box-containing protein
VNLLRDDRVRAVVVTGSDVTAGRMRQIARRLESRLLEGLPAAVVLTDDRGVVVYWNERAASMYGYAAEEAVGRPAAALNAGPVDRRLADSIRAAVREAGRWEGDFDARHRDGSTLPVYATLKAIADPDIGFSGIVSAAIDISERRRLESDLAFSALHDPLTGLPNRRLFVDHVESALARSARHGKATAVLCLDLDRFKAVNDAVGAAAGDGVLQAVAEFLDGLVRQGDLVARPGGDEFVVCCEDVDDAAEAIAIAEQMLHVLRAPFRSGDRTFEVSASIGVAVTTGGGPAEAIIRKADAAMYAAKEAGGARVELFDDESHDRARRRHSLAVELADALDRRQLEVFYQPEIGVATGALMGFEALVRWRHPERGLVPPDEFIGIAEESALVGRLGQQVLEAACASLARWMVLMPEHPLTMAVNVSARQLADPEFPEAVRRTIAASEIPASRVCLEVTESALLDHGVAERSLRALKAIGVLIAIDDFGTGYSSLSRLRRFPVDFLKIDRSFVDGIGRDPEDDVIVATVVSLAHTLGLGVVAEGIETVDQLERLAALGCEQGQGWLWERAVDEATASALVVERTTGWEHRSPSVHREVDHDDSPASIDATTAVGLLVHELSGPLTVLTGFAELLADMDDPQRRLLAARAVERNARLARSALALVSDIAELDSGTLRLNPEWLCLRDAVEDAVALAQAREGNAVTFQVDIDDVRIHADADRLVAATANLLTNARKFAPAGSTVRVWNETTEAGIAVHVTDDGPGVPPELVGTIFRKFGRADRRRPGSGLGLFLARGVARAHRGELSYRRAPGGGGADFVFELPTAPEGT